MCAAPALSAVRTPRNQGVKLDQTALYTSRSAIDATRGDIARDPGFGGGVSTDTESTRKIVAKSADLSLSIIANSMSTTSMVTTKITRLKILRRCAQTAIV